MLLWKWHCCCHKGGVVVAMRSVVRVGMEKEIGICC